MNETIKKVLKECEELLKEDTYDTINGPRLSHPELLAEIQALLAE